MRRIARQNFSFLFQMLLCCLVVNATEAQVLVADINQDNKSSHPYLLASNDSYLTFFANGDEGLALYALAAGEDELQLVYNLSTADQGEVIRDANLFGNNLYFITYEESIAYFHRTNLATGSTISFFELPTTAASSGNIGKLTQLGDLVLFINRNASFQFELWKTDGSASGTQLISTFSNNAFLEHFTVFNDELYFTIREDQAKGEIWKTDGNTVELLIDTDPTNSVTNFGTFNLTVFNNKLYFDAFSPEFGYEVWSSDGTTAGTQLFNDFLMGSESVGSSIKGVIGNQLFLSITDPMLVNRLYVSDGTVAGTQVYVAIDPVLEGSRIGTLVGTPNIIYFARSLPTSGIELWRSDGTPTGTFLLKDIRPGIGNSIHFNFTAQLVGDALFFVADDGQHGLEIWKTDGTTAGTTLWSDIYPGSNGSGIESLQFFDNQLFFDSTNPEFGNELWTNDITVSDPQLVQDLNSSTASSSFPTRFNEIDGTLYFQARTDCLGFEVFKTNGTANSTVLLKDAFPGSDPSNASDVISLQGQLYFTANRSDFERRIWKSDGSESGTNFIGELDGVPTEFGGQGMPAILNNKIILRDFVSGIGQCIIDIDATTGAAQVVKVINPNFGGNASGTVFTPLNDSILLFVDRDTVNGHELWRTNGTEEGTYMVKNILPEPSNFVHISRITTVDGIAYFKAGDSNTGERLWRTDGTEQGTYSISDSSLGAPREIIELNGEIYCFAWATGIYNLLKTDGSSSNTQLAPYNGSNPNFIGIRNVNLYKDRLYFIGTTNATGEEIWFYDPTTQSLDILKDIYPGPEGKIRDLAVGDSLLYFGADDGVHGLEFWKSDGTPDETEMVADLWPGEESSYPGAFYPYQNFIFFRADRGDEMGLELYKYSPLDKDNDGYLPPEDMDDTDPTVNVSNPNDPLDVNTFCSTDSTSTNTVDITWMEAVAIHPNPASHFIQVDLPDSGQYTVSIVDLLGRPIAVSNPSNGRASFDVDQWTAGTYLVRIRHRTNGTVGLWKVLIL
ncbi:MAG: T9SS type A sorting domain-containing protein, partial [Bacteroidota bacterium]